MRHNNWPGRLGYIIRQVQLRHAWSNLILGLWIAMWLFSDGSYSTLPRHPLERPNKTSFIFAFLFHTLVLLYLVIVGHFYKFKLKYSLPQQLNLQSGIIVYLLDYLRYADISVQVYPESPLEPHPSLESVLWRPQLVQAEGKKQRWAKVPNMVIIHSQMLWKCFLKTFYPSSFLYTCTSQIFTSSKCVKT